MPNLSSLQAKWIELFDELYSTPNTAHAIAAPFLSVPAAKSCSILYVGKATYGDWYKEEFCRAGPSATNELSTEARVKERRERTRKFVLDEAFFYNSGFWQFAKELDAMVAKKRQLPPGPPLKHIVWTNICKIGAVGRNPSGSLFGKQQKLAVETLRQEIESYKPQLICFVTWDYAWELVKEAIGDRRDTSWDKSGNEQWCWFYKGSRRLPGMLLTGHPQGKANAERQFWLKVASQLLPT